MSLMEDVRCYSAVYTYSNYTEKLFIRFSVPSVLVFVCTALLSDSVVILEMFWLNFHIRERFISQVQPTIFSLKYPVPSQGT